MKHRSALLAGLAFLTACADAGLGPSAPLLNVSPGPQVVVNEVMADPVKVTDDAGEWIEVHNWGATAVNLQGWTIVSANDAPHTISTPVSLPAGGHVVLARNGTKSKNGGVTAQYAYGTGVNLANGSDWLVLRDGTGATVDSVAWTSMPAGATRGVRDPSTDNAAAGGASWQTATSPYGAGDRGTPGARNDGYVAPVLQPATVNVTPAGASVGVGGTQQFAAAALDAWGNPITATFTWTSTDTTIARVSAAGLATAVRAGSAQIRATAANGVWGEATLSVSPAGAARLVINEVMPNPNAVTDEVGEWIEIHNWGTASVDLRNYVLAGNNDAGHTIASSVVVPAGGFVVLARNGTSGQNGGVSAAYAYGTALTLANSADWVVLRDPAGATVDSVAWASVPTGASRGVADASAENADAGGANWTTQTTVFGAGDRGTPGARNDGWVSPGPAGPPASVTVTPSSASVDVGAALQLAATARDAEGRATSTTFTWTTTSAGIATVDASGRVTGVGAGTVTVRATASNGVYGEAAVTVTTPPPPGTVSELVVRVLDVGQGDANLITNGGSRVIIDGGPSEARFGALLDSLGLNGTTIDAVILSHQHADHLAGLQELFRTSRGITIRYFFENRDTYSSVSLQELRDSVNARAGRGELVIRDTDDPCGTGAAICTLRLDGGAKLHVLRPDPASANVNNRSVPVKLVGPDSASFSMWFAGDAEHEAIDWFDAVGNYDVSPGMDVNVLKADHHGSCNGLNSRYLDLLTPDWVTFSLAAANEYGHVHTQTRELFAQYGRPWYRTDQNGTVTIRTPGTPGGGYTITASRGSQSATGPSDRASTAAACQAL